MPAAARERLRNIMMATEHGTRSTDHIQIDLLQLVAELLIEIKAELGQPGQPVARPAPPPPAPSNGHQPRENIRSAAFGL